MVMQIEKRREIRLLEIALATFLWLAILLPWIELDFSNGENALVIAFVAGGLGISELTSITSFEDLAAILAGFLFLIGVICICIYAMSGLYYGVKENHFLNPKLRKVFLLTGFLPAIISSGYFYHLFHTENASHFTGISLGYWIYWIGIIISSFFEFRNSRLLRRAMPSSQ